MVRLRQAVGAVDLIDARSNDPRVQEARRRGYDLDEGMVVIWEGRPYLGGDAVHLIAMLSAQGGVSNGVERRLFRSRRLTARLYPLLARGRRAWLRLVGRPPIGAAEKKSAPPE